MVSLSLGAINGDPSGPVPRAFAALGYNVFADVVEADVSIRPPDYARIPRDERDEFVSGADLRGKVLRHIDASDASLQKANFVLADLTAATLTGAMLSGADFSAATLTDANLSVADLSGADLRFANLSVGARIEVHVTSRSPT